MWKVKIVTWISQNRLPLVFSPFRSSPSLFPKTRKKKTHKFTFSLARETFSYWSPRLACALTASSNCFENGGGYVSSFNPFTSKLLTYLLLLSSFSSLFDPTFTSRTYRYSWIKPSFSVVYLLFFRVVFFILSFFN